MESEAKLEMIRNACDEKKAADLVVIDLRGKTLISDFFVLCSGTSRIHCRAIADGVLETMKKEGIKGIRCEGYEQGTWILIDYADVVLHVFSDEERQRYNLEDLWRRVNTTEAAPTDAPVYAGRAPRELDRTV